MLDDKSLGSVPHRLVHKRASAEVLVSAVNADDGGWVLEARLPGRHRFHTDVIGRQSRYHDPLFVLEAFRQGCVAASHVFYGVPLDFRYVLRYYGFRVRDLDVLAMDSGPAEFEFSTVIRREFRARGATSVTGLEVAATARRGGSAAMELSGGFGWMTEEQWRSTRSGSQRRPGPQPPTAEPRMVGRTHAEHVVIGEPRRRDRSMDAGLVVDIDNPTFFDHPLDHLPGGLILEACRQLAMVSMGPDSSSVVGPTTLRCDFHSFAELSPPCVVTLETADHTAAFRAEVSQSGVRRASVELAFTAGEYGR